MYYFTTKRTVLYVILKSEFGTRSEPVVHTVKMRTSRYVLTIKVQYVLSNRARTKFKVL